jgi:metal-responsive CopG/Arc/MetJ family transcriptional regulator
MAKKPRRKAVRLSEERIGLRLPRTLLRQVDGLCAEALCPRSYALRRLIMRGLEQKETVNG